MRRFGILGGGILTALLAGPLFLALTTLTTKPSPDPPSGFDLGPAIVIPFSIAIGFILSAVPILLGTLAMSRLGHRYPAARHPLAWALAGAILGWPVAVVLDKGFVFPLVLTFLATGAGCALILRGFMAWSGPNG